MAPGSERPELLNEVWRALGRLYENRSPDKTVAEIAAGVGLSQSGLSRVFPEARDAHLSTVSRIAKALSYEVQVHFIPEDQLADDFEFVIVHESTDPTSET